MHNLNTIIDRIEGPVMMLMAAAISISIFIGMVL